MSAVSTGGEYQEDVYKADGTINIEYIPNWIYFLEIKKNKVIDERNNQRVKLGHKNGNNNGNELDRINELKKKSFKFIRNIKALKKKVAQEKDDNKEDGNDETEDDGDQFGRK